LPHLLQTLRGLIRCRLAGVTPAFRVRLSALADGRLREPAVNVIELECNDVKGELVRLIGLLNEMGVELVHLETEEPNLERVFLHLTGRGLRD
jgi:hypothetical protein